MNVIVAITAASGALYARLVLESLLGCPEVARVGVIFSRQAREVADHEGVVMPLHERITLYANDDMFASPASGSAAWDAMVIAPCSVGTAGRIAAGVSGSLIERAADVMLKERRPLVLVVRETPLSLIHLRNLTSLTEAGAVVLPASPSFYSRPTTIEQACRTVVERVVAQLGLNMAHFEWGDK